MTEDGFLEFLKAGELDLRELKEWVDVPEIDIEELLKDSPDLVSRGLDNETKRGDTMEVVLTGSPEAFSARFMDELHKYCQKNGVIVQSDDSSRPKRRYWGQWKKGEVQKPD